MLPWKTIIQLQKDGDTPVYLQIANAIIMEMKRGRIGPSIKLPGSRAMAEILNVHRKTLVKAYDELNAQGWIEMIPSKEPFTSKELAEINPRILSKKNDRYNSYPAETGYRVKINDKIKTPVLPH